MHSTPAVPAAAAAGLPGEGSSPAGTPEPGEGGGAGWLSGRELAPAGRAEAVWADAAALGEGCWPQAADPAREVLTRWAAFRAVLGEELDAQLAGEPAGERLRLTGHIVRLREGEATPAAAGPYDSRFTRAFDEIWRELATPMGEGWQRRFLGHCLEYLRATAWEAQNRARATPPGLVEYIHRRRHSSGAGPGLDLVEYAAETWLPTGFHTLPAVRTALLAAADITGWHRDLAALDGDIERGETNNLVLVTAHEQHRDLESAAGLVRERLRARLHDFDRSTARHARQSRQSRHRNTHGPHATRYLSGVRSWVHGSLVWRPDE